MKHRVGSFWPAGLLVLLTLFAGSGSALAEVSARGPSGIFGASYLLQVLGSLLLVFGCLFGLAFLLKKKFGVRLGERASIQVLGSLRVGSREKILLLTAGEQQLLVGVAAGNIRTLHVFENEPGLSSDTPSGQPADFASLIETSSSGIVSA